MKFNITIDMDDGDWYPEDQSLEEYIANCVKEGIGKQLLEQVKRDVVFTELLAFVRDDVRQMAKAELTLLLSGPFKMKFASNEATMREHIILALEDWAESRNGRRSGLQDSFLEAVHEETRKQAKPLLDEIKGEAVEKARASLAQTLAEHLFTGDGVLKLG